MLGLLWLYVAQPAYADTIYIVQPGDNLYRISLRFSVSQPALMAANSLTDPSRIYAGERLVIPGGGTPSAAASAEPAAIPAATATPPPASPVTGRYVVQPGDTLHQIASQFGVSQTALMQVNGISNPNRIVVGETLQLPAGAAGATARAGDCRAAGDRVPTPAAPASGTYVVQRGDLLWSLAQRFGVSAADIQQDNRLSSGWLYSGQVLVLPGSAAAAGALPTVAALPAGDATRPAWLPPWIPAVSARMRQIYAQSSRQGHNPRIFTVVGDCNSDYPVYLGPVGVHLVDLSAYPYLDATVNHFSASFLRHSLAAQGGFNAGSMMDPTWADPAQCLGGEGPLACELRVSRASIALSRWARATSSRGVILKCTIGR